MNQWLNSPNELMTKFMNAFLSVMDHGITINWEQGPTLHKVLAQVRYRHSQEADAPVLTMRVGASQRCAEVSADLEEMHCFAASNGDLAAQWIWQAKELGWVAMLVVRNVSDEAIWLEAADIVRIDAQTGLLSLGAPATDWHTEHAAAQLRIWPTQSDRGEPTAVILKALPSDEPPQPQRLDEIAVGQHQDQAREDEVEFDDDNEVDDGDDDNDIDLANTAGHETKLMVLGEPSAVAINLEVANGRFNQVTATLSFAKHELPPNSGVATPSVMIWAEPI